MIEFEDVKDETTGEYFKNNQYSVDMFEAKYSFTKEDEETKETPAEVFWRVASELSQFEDNPEFYAKRWFSMMYEGWFRPGGSILGGVGTDKKVSLANCTTIPIEGDSIESISKAEYTLMKCAAARQGMGIDLSNLRPRGAKLGNAAEYSTGTIPWGAKFSDVGEYVGQEGRMPAILLSEKISHPDTEEFITSKKEKGKVENANISVQITDKFMKTLENGENWTLSFDTNRESIRKEVDPEYLFDLIAETASQSAEPGVQYIDRLREGTISHALYKATGNPKYKVVSTNACSEKPLSPYNICNLLSINMEMFSIEEQEFKRELENIVPYLVKLSDNVVEYELQYNLSPIPEQKEILEKMREIGLGITNLHGWLLKNNIQYDSDEAMNKAERFMMWYTYYVFKCSMELGREKGNAPAFDELEDKSVLLESQYIRNIVDTFFNGDVSLIYNMRNMAHMSIAPTGSLSSTFPNPCISSGVEPVISPWYWRRTRAVNKGEWDYYFVIPQKVKEYVMSFIPQESEDYERLEEFSGSCLDNDGKIGLELIEVINKYISEGFFKPAHEIDYLQKVKLLSNLYKWVDAAISCTFNLPVTATKEDVKNIYWEAYNRGVRAVSVYREGSREGILIFEDPVTHKKKYNPKDQLCLERPEDIAYHCAPKRPEVLECNVHHASVKGEKWLVLIGMLNGKPYELFAGEQEDLYLPKSVETGTITKNGNGKYNLIVKIRKNEVEYKDIANVLMSGEQRSLTRLLSTCLRHGVPVEFITDQLKKAKEDITDFASAVSRVLSKYDTGLFNENEVCPVCGEEMIPFEGCIKCVNELCQYSRCS